MSRIRAIFLGTPEIARTCLSAMVADPHFEVVAVVSQPDRPAGRKLKNQPSAVKTYAESIGLPVLTPERVSEPEILEQLKAYRAETAVVVAYGQILKQAFLDMYPQKVVNVHASLLPRWRGAAPIQRALMSGDAETGVALQIMVKKLDAGPVLGVRKIPLPPEMNAVELYQQCEQLGAQLLNVELMDYLRGHLGAVAQDEAHVTLAPKIDKAEAEIDWCKSASEIHNKVRGLALGPVAHTKRDGRILKIHRTRALSAGAENLRAGQVRACDEKSLIVQCGTGSLELLELQPESRAKMSVTDYLRGHGLNVGDQLGQGPN